MGVDELRTSRTALLTTFRRNGEAVATPVSLAVAGGRAYFVTAVGSGKARRLAHDPRVRLAPCTVWGDRLGADVPGRARLLEVAALRHLTGVLRPTGPLFGSWLMYRLRGKTMALYEVTLDEPEADPDETVDERVAGPSHRMRPRAPHPRSSARCLSAPGVSASRTRPTATTPRPSAGRHGWRPRSR